MKQPLQFSVRYLQPFSHGRGDQDKPEWPPSPLRFFQALTSSALGRSPDERGRSKSVAALRWLENQAAPRITAPPASLTGPGYRLFVPDNVGDLVAASWTRGGDDNIANYRTEKDVRPLHLSGERVDYRYECDGDLDAHAPTLKVAARSLTHLGWGVDMVAGDVTMDAPDASAETWLPIAGEKRLRVPVVGTLDALEARHQSFLSRLEGEVFRPVPPLKTFAIQGYTRAHQVRPAGCLLFRIVQQVTLDRLSFEPERRARDVAAWVRHAVSEAARGWPEPLLRTAVHGHPSGEGSGRLSYLPLPTINPALNRVEGIGRVLVVATDDLSDRLLTLRPALAGADLHWAGNPVATLEALPVESDWVAGQYLSASEMWSTVTPVVLPGHHDNSPAKAEKLLFKTMRHAGLSEEIVSGVRELEWRKVGFRAGTAHADRYRLPDGIKGPAFHVRVRFATAVRGPLFLGSGRHRGLGIFARG